MDADGEKAYQVIRTGGSGVYEQQRGLVAVWGGEAVQFLDGLITNDVKTLQEGQQMLAAFPNAQGRLLAVVRVQKQGDRFLFETEEATRQPVFQNLFRFTFAGDFFVEDLSNDYRCIEIFGAEPAAFADGITFTGASSVTYFRPLDDNKRLAPKAANISDELYETLRIENGIPKYGVDMDETTIVPELGLEGLISYNKGCYIGQEIIARIHFRGHVAKRLTGLRLSSEVERGTELSTPDGKNAGRMTSVTFSPELDGVIALGYVRYDHLAAGTELRAGDLSAVVSDLPFV
ncbi:MAG: folate-binding protein YgfZ [Pyrinomonadaceae bacterium]|nr:folate-binding protein YgfZ [Pyrinomonadaceae bacterium]